MKNTQVEQLSAEGKRLYDRTRKEWAIREEPGLTVLLVACQSFDRLRQAQDLLNSEGIIVTDRWEQAKPHPATQVERESRAHFLQAVKALNLDLESLEGD